jgi:propionate CoA-transferase
MAEVDAEGNVNVSRFRPKLAGPGGFVNISQNAKSVFFLATFSPKTQTVIEDGRLRIVQDGASRRFVDHLQQLTFSGRYPLERGQSVHYITERCVFRLGPAGLELSEVAPGVNIEDDVLAYMEFKPIVPENVAVMDPRIFRDEPMGLARWTPLTMEERLTYDAERNVVHVNFEGLRTATPDDVQELAAFLDRAFSRFGHRVHVVVNYDNFELLPPAEDAFFAMVRRNTERYFLSSTRYSTNAFYRHLLGEQFTNARLSQRIYPSIAGVQADLPDRTNSEGPSQAPADQVRQRRPAPGHRCLQPTHVGEYARSR